MKTIILIVEDVTEEQQKAKSIASNLGFTPIVANDLESGVRILKQLKDKIFCVVTDLHYPSASRFLDQSQKPNGLAMIAVCVESGIRVGVCSDINHHYSEYLKIPIQVLSSHQSYPFNLIPFSEDSKDWEMVIKKTTNL